MFELSIEQIKMVSGGASDQSGNNYGDYSSNNQKSDGVQWTNRKVGEPGLISSAATIAGSAWGPLASAAAFSAGHFVETRDYKKIGEDYKTYIDEQIKNGIYPPD